MQYFPLHYQQLSVSTHHADRSSSEIEQINSEVEEYLAHPWRKREW
jgi:hypothetical protein